MTPEMMLAKMLSTTPVMVEKTAEVENYDPESDSWYSAEAEEKVAFAHTLGQELAREHMEKAAVVAFGAGKILGGIGSAAKAVAGAAKAAPGAGKSLINKVKSAPGAAKEFMKKDWAATKEQFKAGLKGQARPGLKPTAVPGVHHNVPSGTPAAPAKSGGGLGRAAVLGGVGAAGLAGGYAVGRKHQQGQQKAASVDIHEVLEKLSFPAMGSLLQSAKGVATKGLAAAKPMAGKAINSVMSTSSGRHAAIGAGVGAVGGALKDPGYDAQGNRKSRLGNMAVGAGIGAAGGAALKPALGRLGGSNTGVGNYIRSASAGAMPKAIAGQRMLGAGG